MTDRHVDREAVARAWRKRGFSCDLRVDPPGEVWADYVHDVDELAMVVEGDVECEIEGKVHRLAPGEELIIPTRATHEGLTEVNQCVNCIEG
jgi:mannose-6-phosphate isomerase-like protein (cupin superfamily)